MSRTDPPPPQRGQRDVDALLRAFVEQPVVPLPASEAMQLRERITRGLEVRQVPRPAESTRESPRAGRWRPWLLFAAAACLPIAVWGVASSGHAGPARRTDAAVVTALGGHAEIARGDTESSIAKGGSAPLGPGEELRTETDAWARASLPTGAIVDVGPLARLQFTATGGGPVVRDRLDLVAGRIDVRVPKLAAGGEVRVLTQEATVVVHGTKFSVERIAASGARSGETRVSVTEGVVAVDSDQGERTLTAGMDLVVPARISASAASSSPAPAMPSTGASEPPEAATGSTSPSTLAAENALLAEAMKLHHGRQDDRSLVLLDAFLGRYPGSPLTETARVERLGVLEAIGTAGPLAREAERYLADYPRGYFRREATRMRAAARADLP
jgi:hypothetical protein